MPTISDFIFDNLTPADYSSLMNSPYEKLGIYELRNFARNIGVPSPTTKKKNELIEQIILIESGVQKPQRKTNGQGCPPRTTPKEIIENNLILNKMFKENLYLAIKQNNETNKTLKKLMKFLK